MAELNFSIEQGRVEIQLASPAANIVGFESKASSPEQEHLAIQAKANLEVEQRLFKFAGTQCHRESVAVDVSSVMTEAPDQQQAPATGKTRGESHHDTHDDQVKEVHATHHSEIIASYLFTCDDTAGLTAISVDIFDLFPGIERIQTMWVTPATQGATELTKQQRSVSFE